MILWEEVNNNDKTWIRCQKCVEDAYIMRKWYNDAKGQMQDNINQVTETEWKLHREAMEAKAMQEANEQSKHIQINQSNAQH